MSLRMAVKYDLGSIAVTFSFVHVTLTSQDTSANEKFFFSFHVTKLPRALTSKMEVDIIMFTYWLSALALRIMGIALRLARQCLDNGLVKYWLKENSPGNIDL